MEFIPGLMQGEQVNAIRENLTALKQSMWADDNRAILFAVIYGAGPDQSTVYTDAKTAGHSVDGRDGRFTGTNLASRIHAWGVGTGLVLGSFFDLSSHRLIFSLSCRFLFLTGTARFLCHGTRLFQPVKCKLESVSDIQFVVELA